MPRPYKKQPFFPRFWSKVQIGKEDECWLWLGAKDKNGYGEIKAYGQRFNHKAHRMAWEIHNGRSAKGHLVLHSCDNPACVNPAHLSLGTPQENSSQCSKRKRFNHAGEHNGRAKLTQIDVDQIRILYFRGVKRKAICYQFQISKQHLLSIATYKCWSCPNPETVPVLWRENV